MSQLQPTGAADNLTFDVIVLRQLDRVLEFYTQAADLEKENVYRFELALRGLLAMMSAVSNLEVSLRKSTVDLQDKKERADFLERSQQLIKVCVESMASIGIVPTQITTLILAGNVYEAKQSAKHLLKHHDEEVVEDEH